MSKDPYFIKLIKQITCNHKWIPKGKAVDNEDYRFSESRCPKCKKIKVNFVNK